MKKVLDSVVEYRLYTNFVGDKPARIFINERNNYNEKYEPDRFRN